MQEKKKRASTLASKLNNAKEASRRFAAIERGNREPVKVGKPAETKPAETKPAGHAVGGKPAAKKGKKRVQKPAGPPPITERAQLLSQFMRTTLDAQSRDTGQNEIYVGGEAACSLVGIQLPSFSLEYLFGLNILPFGIVMLLVGQEEVGKSGLAFEIARWFRRLAAGYVLYIDNESKLSPSWHKSIMGWDDPGGLKISHSRSMQDWQGLLLDDTQRFKEFCLGTESKPGPGKIFAYLQILDTLMGKSTLESEKRIEKAGFAGRSHPDEARSITQFLRAYPQRLPGWPAVFLVLNQLRNKKTETGAIQREMAGGSQIKFQVSYQFELKRNPTTPFARRGEWAVSRLQLRSFKNSFAEDFSRKSIPINVCVRQCPQFDAELGETANRQQTVWDWHSSTTELIANLLTNRVRTSETLRAATRKRLKDLVPLKPARGGRYSCPPLGVPDGSPVTPHALGRAIHNNPTVMAGLRELFGIQVWPGFDTEVTYDEQLARARRRIADRLRQLSPDHVMRSGFDQDMDVGGAGDVEDQAEENEGTGNAQEE